MDSEYDYTFKILLIGDSSVGKTSVLLRFVDDKFTPEFQTTIGVDFKISTFEIEGKVIKLQLWDTAGQDRFRNIVSSYYRGAQGICLLYDITATSSFQSITKWHEESNKYLSESIPKLLIGNKADLNSSREISHEQGAELAESYGMEFIETSAKNGTGVKEAFEMMARSIFNSLSSIPQPSYSATRVSEGKVIKTGGSWCCS